MIVHIDKLLNQAQRHLSKSLVSEEALETVRTAARFLPEFSGGICLECRLEANSPQVDFMVCGMVSDGGPQAFARALSSAHDRLTGPLWDGVRAFSREWLEPGSVLSRVPVFWIEYDLGASFAGVPKPFAFVCVQPQFDQVPPISRRARGATLEEPLRLTWRALDVLQGRPLAAATAKTLSRCFEHLPELGEVEHVATLAARGSDAVRLSVSVPRQELGEYLERIGWPGSRSQIEEIAQNWLSPLQLVTLNLDAGDTIGPTLGFGLTMPEKPRGTWAERLLQRLVESGLCTRAKSDAVLAWPGVERAIIEGHRWPSKLCRTIGVKLVCRPNEPLTAKAYPYYECRFALW